MDQVEVKVIASVRDFLSRVIEANALPPEMLMAEPFVSSAKSLPATPGIAGRTRCAIAD